MHRTSLNHRLTSLLLSILTAWSLLVSGCDQTDVDGLYRPELPVKPDPAITSVSPTGLAVAGMDSVTIQGTNFSAAPFENSVHFNATKAELVSASTTQLVAIAPLVVGDSVAVRVSVDGAVGFSNTIPYALAAGVTNFGDLEPATNISPQEQATALSTDSTGTLYVAYTRGTSDAGILSFSSDGVRSVYAAATGGVAFWTNIRFGPGSYLYAARNFRAIYRFPVGGVGSATLWLAFPTGTSINDLEFDADGNMWAGGNNSNIYRILPDKTIATFPFVGNIRSVRVFGGSLYFAARTTEGEKVWRGTISPGGLGTPEVYFDLNATHPEATPKTITFSSDGTLFIATNAAEGLVVVNPDGSWIAPFNAYGDSFKNGVGALAWGQSTTLYACTTDGFLLAFMIRGRSSAPYYGSIL